MFALERLDQFYMEFIRRVFSLFNSDRNQNE